MSKHAPPPVSVIVPPDTRFAVLAARFNAHIVDKLLEGCLARLGELGVDSSRIEIHRVPGAYELPVAALLAAKTGRFDAVIGLGCVIRGDTPHFEYVAGQCAQGLQQVALSQGLPVIFGVLTTNNEQQALDRAGGSHSHAGRNAADAAAEMVALAATLKK